MPDSDRIGTTLIPSVLTLIVVLTVIAVSGAVVLVIVLGDETKPATPETGSRPRPPSPDVDVQPASVPAGTRLQPGPPAGARAPAPVRPNRVGVLLPGAGRARAPALSRVRSAVLLVVLLTSVGSLLAVVVGAALVLLVMGVRSGVG